MKKSSAKSIKPLSGKHLLINAGPTREKIDPVRFISNFSSGKMGIALAKAAMEYGASVNLVLGPVNQKIPAGKIKVRHVESATEMADECIKLFPDCDIAILSAAVADYTPVSSPKSKIKKGKGEMLLRLKATTDIAGTLGRMKRKDQILTGFALETDDAFENAFIKLKAKNLDLIVVNSLADQGAGFGHDTNVISILDSNNNIDKFELKSKHEAARDILDKIVSMLK